ncbi:MAG: hypothetical protein GY757_50220, partial [bacterium]|nr:hypothetical protein [bacterium]
LFARLDRLSGGSHLRLHMALTAAVMQLIEKYTGSRDIIVGTPIYKQDVEGEFVNTVVPLRNRLEKDGTFRTLLLQVRKTISEGMDNYSYPVYILLEKLNLPVPENDFPLFDVAIMLENIQDREYLRHLDLNMIFSFLKKEETIKGVMEYNASLFKEASVKRITGHLVNLMERMLA